MSKRSKRLDRIRQNPTNVSLDDLRRVLEDYGFVLERSEGSHFTFSVIIANQTKLLVVPYRRPVKPIYVKKALQIIDEVVAGQGVEETDEIDDD